MTFEGHVKVIEHCTDTTDITANRSTLCLKKRGPTLKRYSSKLCGSILMIFGRNIQKSLE